MHSLYAKFSTIRMVARKSNQGFLDLKFYFTTYFYLINILIVSINFFLNQNTSKSFQNTKSNQEITSLLTLIYFLQHDECLENLS
jgi:hypothetical protein